MFLIIFFRFSFFVSNQIGLMNQEETMNKNGAEQAKESRGDDDDDGELQAEKAVSDF